MTATLHALPSPQAATTPAEKTARTLTGLGYQPGDMGYVFGDSPETAAVLSEAMAAIGAVDLSAVP